MFSVQTKIYFSSYPYKLFILYKYAIINLYNKVIKTIRECKIFLLKYSSTYYKVIVKKNSTKSAFFFTLIV